MTEIMCMATGYMYFLEYNAVYNVLMVSLALYRGSVFYNCIPKTLSETSRIWIVSSISLDGATLEFGFCAFHGSRESDARTDRLADRQTDRVMTKASFFQGKKR